MECMLGLGILIYIDACGLGYTLRNKVVGRSESDKSGVVKLLKTM